eukprot:3129395-Pyramimonas_sp.AAC.1
MIPSGAIISGGKGTAQDKIAALKSAGVSVVSSPAQVGLLLGGFRDTEGGFRAAEGGFRTAEGGGFRTAAGGFRAA